MGIAASDRVALSSAGRGVSRSQAGALLAQDGPTKQDVIGLSTNHQEHVGNHRELAERVGFEPTVRLDRTTVFEFYDSHADSCRPVSKRALWFANCSFHDPALYRPIPFCAAQLVCNLVCKLSPRGNVRLPRVSELSDPRLETLRLFCNGCFHYQRDYEKFAPFLSGDLESFDWAERLQMQFGAYFAKHRTQQSAGSHGAGRFTSVFERRSAPPASIQPNADLDVPPHVRYWG